MPSRESKRLVDAASAGSRTALDTLFSRCQGRLRRLLWLKAGPSLRTAELDDLVQEAYLEATRQFENYTYQGPDSFFRWMATVALHRLANLQRVAGAQKRDARRERPIDAVSDTRRAPTLADMGPGPATLTAGAEAQQRLDRVLLQMSETDREVILLARVQGLSLPEIATQMGRTRNAVALLLSRSLRKLKKLLDEAQGL